MIRNVFLQVISARASRPSKSFEITNWKNKSMPNPKNYEKDEPKQRTPTSYFIILETIPGM